MRAGTENVAGIVGFGAAARMVRQANGMAQAGRLRDSFEAALALVAPDAVIFGAATVRLPNTCLFAVPDLSAQTALIAFDLDGVAVSSGSACSSGKVARSHVLAAMGVPEALAACTIRLSLGATSTEADIARCLSSLERQLGRLRARRPSAA